MLELVKSEQGAVISAPEIKVYVINLERSDLDVMACLGDKDYEAIITEAESLGSVYSLQGFQNAINLEELYLDNSYIYIG